MRVGYVLGAVLIAIAALALMLVQPPGPLGPDADPGVFSAHRAWPMVKRMAQTPHFTGTAENAQVRDDLLAQLRALGLEPQVQSAFAVTRSPRKQHLFLAGQTHNVLVRIPGQAADRATRKAVLLAAHYDSVQHGPGGADDTASVAAILETLRAVRHGVPLQNDLIVLLSDGEEVGLLGAQAFVAEHPWAKDVALVFNFEYRGNRGAMQMFETSAGNGRLIDGLAKAVPHPVANSLNYEVYKRLPNDTDLTALKQGEMAGLNFAAIDGHVVYHTPLDTAENLSLATLQHEGDTMLALVRHFGNQDLSQLQAPDAVYFDIAAQVLVHYPVAWAWPLSAAITLLAAWVAWQYRQRQAIRPKHTALAAAGYGLMFVLVPAAAYVLWRLVLLAHPEYRLMFMGSLYNGGWYLAAFAGLLCAVFASLLAFWRRRCTAAEWGLGVTVVLLLPLWLTSLALPGVSWVLAWPLLGYLLAALALLRWGGSATFTQRAWVQLLGAVPGLVLLVPLLHAVYVALGPNAGVVFALVLVLLLGLASEVIFLLGRGVGWLGLGVGLASLAGGSLTAGFDAEQPQPSNVYYAKDANSGQAWWVSDDERLDAWSRQFLTDKATRSDLSGVLGSDVPRQADAKGQRLSWSFAAPDLGLPAPEIKVLNDTTTDGRRTLVAEVRSIRSAQQLWLALEGAAVLDSQVNGRALNATAGDVWEFKASGVGAEPLRFQWVLEGGKAFTLRVKDRSFGWPGFEVPTQRPPQFIAKANVTSDSAFVQRSVEFAK